MALLNKFPSILLSISILYYYWKLTITTAYESSSPSKTQFHVAPMQCYTNARTRKLFDLLSPSSIKWTEMEKLDDIYPRTESVDYLLDALEKRLGSPENHHDKANLVLQLGTNDPDRLQRCVEHTIQHYDNIQEINLNCGCPAIESGGASTYGASLMKDAKLTGQLVKSARKGLEGSLGTSHACPKISVKCRIAVFETDQDMRLLTGRDYDYLKDYVSTMHEHGANHVILHARPAILSGLSPVKNRIVPTLDYDFVQRIASEFEGKMDVTLNGGITTLDQLQSLLENSLSGSKSAISSYMAGRWCLRRPLDLIGIEALLKGEELNSSLSPIQNAIDQYVDDAIKIGSSSSFLRHKPTVAELCLPLFLIVEQLRDDYNFEEDKSDNDDSITLIEPPLLTYDEMESLYDVLHEGVAQIEDLFGKGKKKKKISNGSVNFKRLSSSFKSLVGTKVANKWKRNRAEL
uniref:DUS-like FMN-binding domain-containing protein n=1 Tax=Pseudo-nitzschia australis TaxID=44445 RepID=A0A7S4EQR4_9STRA|mmetsp:Transcript_18185/g.39639  ORF Transcript_18185/g.39639 Transcript_18185/m.39639 type:complete len:462 (-) Transcript_18185:63-1448(-)